MIIRKIVVLIISCFLSFSLFAYAQPSPPKKETKGNLPPEIQDKVNDAISRGTAYLYKYISQEELPNCPITDHEGIKHTMRYADLILYTLAHCGVATDEAWDKFVQRVTELPLDRTYHVSLQAMALEHINRDRYQQRIADCAQYLIENQCKNGQWSYGSERDSPRWKKTGADRDKIVVSGDGKNPVSQNTPLTQTPSPSSSSTQSKKITPIKINAKPQGPPVGDNSNTQYAILGLRACIESNIGPLDETLQLAKKWLISSQNKDGSWGYSSLGTIPSQGYGSMSMGAVGSLFIVKHYLKEEKKGEWFDNAMKWITRNYTVSENPGTSPLWLYYYLYAMERLGILAEQEKFGNNDWYLDGAKFLIEKQSQEGDWNNNFADTCFALLFLKRATKPLKIVTSGG